ncbi:MAG: nitronate monooxygenase [Chloroflexi bacterium]|nr:nitronate monooxygenase [Chloroflexota bacterium]
MFETRLTRMLGIKYPILCGGMAQLAKAELVAAVGNAGGLGFLIGSSFRTPSALSDEIKRTKGLTDKPFGVNIGIFRGTQPERVLGLIDTLAAEGVRVVETAGQSPEPYIERFHAAGIKVIHKVPAVRFARTAERVGVDAITLVGFECGGALGNDDVTTFILIPRAVDAVKIPVVAGGGVGDARGFVAALALGAEAVIMGTRFMATTECPAHPKFKEALLALQETDTVVVERPRNTHRVIRGEMVQKVLDLEKDGAAPEEIARVRGDMVGRAATDGNLNLSLVPCGQVVGLVSQIKPVAEVMQEIIQGAQALVGRLGQASFIPARTSA